MSLLVLGTVALDTVKSPSGKKKALLGGSAAHFCMSASMFTKVHLVGTIGDDFPHKHRALLVKKGIDLTSLDNTGGDTFRWEGEYKKDDFNTALTKATVLGVLNGYVPSVTESQKNIPYVFLANLDPDMQMALLKRMKKPRLVGLDSMNLWIQIKRKSLMALMKRVDLFVANDGEAKAITQEDNLIKAARKLRKMGPELVVVKKGEHGVLFYCDKFMFAFPAYPVEKVVDPTGAGDTFAGGLMGYISRAGKISEKTMREALLYATTFSSFNVEGFGVAKTAALTRNDLNKRLAELKKFISV